MKLILDGYFDSNFGDDYMMKIIVSRLHDWQFLVPAQANISPLVTQQQNVHMLEQKAHVPTLIVTGSGFMINSLRALVCEIRWFVQGKKAGDYCLGCNIEPYRFPLSTYLIRKKLEKMQLIVCRDQKSYAWLKAHCKHTKIYQLPDILFSIPEPWLYKPVAPNALGIAMLHRKGDQPDCSYYRAMAKAADYWVEKNHQPVYLFAFNTGSEDDVYACVCVKEKMRFQDQAILIKHGVEDEILKGYAQCKKIIGARFHAAVLAIRTGIPFFPILFREKMKNMLRDLQYPEWGIPIDQIEFTHLRTFLDCEQTAYKLSPDIMEQAQAYTRILKQIIAERM